MLDKIGSFLYHKVFVSIYIKSDTMVVHVEKKNRKGIIFSEEKIFKAIVPNDEILKYISFFTKDTPYFYVAILDPSSTQGAAPTCEHIEINKFYDKALSKYNCFENKWSYYTSKYDLDEVENNFNELGLDFVFSPFVILNRFFEDKIQTNLAIFLLIQESSITLGIFDNNNLLFAQYLNLQNEFEVDEFSINDVDDEVTLEDAQEDSIDLDSMDIDNDLDDLDVFGDIEDLDSIEEIDEFADVEEDADDNDTTSSKDNHKHHNMSESEELFDEDFQMFSAVQTAVKNFYDDDKYDSKFIESIYIADSVGVNSDLKSYFEEEMFLSVYVRQINLGNEISELIQAEIDAI